MPNRRKLTPELAEKIAMMILENKHSITSIVRLSGISRRVFYNWINDSSGENAQNTGLLIRARTRAIEKMNEIEVVEAKRSLIKLLKGFEIHEIKEDIKNLKNGKQKKTVTIITRHAEPDFKIIKFVLENKDSKNFSTRLNRVLTIRSRQPGKA